MKEEELSACQVSPSSVKTLGTANRIFFETFSFLSALLIIMFLVYSVFAFITNIIVASRTDYLTTQNLDYLSISLGAKSRVSTVSPNEDG